MELFFLFLLLAAFLFFLFRKKRKYTSQKPIHVPEKWKPILEQKVHFYHNLDEVQRRQFESDVYRFLQDVRITGVQLEVSLEDRLLVASSAVIPLFGFPAWSYSHLNEVLLYPSHFDRNFTLDSKQEIITGMVGSGVMEGKVILSQPALHQGFDINNDKKNVGIHEFVHLFDKEDGYIDGIPPGYEDKAFTLPWMDFVHRKTREIVESDSDINPYGATNRQEFFAVASEYFFERPHLLKKKHPGLYGHLSKVFRQDMTGVIERSGFKKQQEIGRNDPCPCGSGKKYKKCCMQ